MKLRNILLLSISMCFLSSCSNLFDIFSSIQNGSTSQGGNSGGNISTSQGGNSGSGNSYTSIVTDENNPDKVAIEQTFQDYIDNNAYEIDNVPLVGSPKLLVIPTWFTDSSDYIGLSYKSRVRDDIELAFNGSQSETGWHSVSTYYAAVSGGIFTPTAVVSDWYESNYSVRTAGMMDEFDTGSLVESATNWYFNNNSSESRRDYDYDSDGYIDGVMLIYAAPNYSNNGVSSSYSNLWAYCYWITDNYSNISNPVPNAYFWSSYDFMYGSSTARSRTGASYYGGDTSNCTVDAHTFIHETGHIIGYDYDLYDVNGNYEASGGFSMQDMNVGGHDPFSVMGSGWADPYIPTETTTIKIGAFQKTRELILLTNDWNPTSSAFDEYLLLELYTPTGLNEFDTNHQYDNHYPQGPNTVGIRLWHVDARLTTFNNYSYSSFSTNFFTDPTEADYGAVIAMSNTYYDRYGDANDYITMGQAYSDYNLLQLIRNDTTETYRPESDITNSDLFGDGSSFNMSTYRRQFVKTSGSTASLNSGETLGWSFSVSISGSGHDAVATVTCTKA